MSRCRGRVINNEKLLETYRSSSIDIPAESGKEPRYLTMRRFTQPEQDANFLETYRAASNQVRIVESRDTGQRAVYHVNHGSGTEDVHV